MRVLLPVLLLAILVTLGLVLGSERAPEAVLPPAAKPARPGPEAASLVPPDESTDAAPRASAAFEAALDLEPRVEVEPAAAAPDSEFGPCTLSLQLRDRATGEPMSSRVELWQLDVPESEVFTAGDRKLHDFVVPAQGYELRDLPVGVYRVVAYAQWRRAEDPPAFRVEAPRTEVVLELDRPRPVRVVVELYDEHGRPTEGVWMSNELAMLSPARSSWMRPRARKVPASTIFGSGGGGSGPSSRRFQPVTLPHELGVFVEADRSRGPTRQATFWYDRAPSNMAVRVDARGRIATAFDDLLFVEPSDSDTAEPLPAATRTYVGLALPAAYFDLALELPAGVAGDDPKAINLLLESQLVERTPDSPWDLWRDIPVQVTATAPGCEELVFEYRLADGPPRQRTLVPLAPDAER